MPDEGEIVRVPRPVRGQCRAHLPLDDVDDGPFRIADGRDHHRVVVTGEVDGEIVVSAETAWREADRREVGAEAELLLYVIHGTLHLLGFDDAAAEDAASMHEKEDALLIALGYGPVYQSGQWG